MLLETQKSPDSLSLQEFEEMIDDSSNLLLSQEFEEEMMDDSSDPLLFQNFNENIVDDSWMS